MTKEALRDLTDFRLVIVTGKGGTGKTTVCCRLAEAARRAGKRVLLAETSPIESIAAYFEKAPRPLGYKGRDLRKNLHALRLDPHEALADYVRVQLGLGVLTDRILRLETFQQLLEAAPGWRELIILGKIWHLEQKRDPVGAHVYDLLIVDAPSTGHGLTFLDVPRVVQQALRSGPLARHASWVEALIHDPERTLLLPVTTPEDLPVQETHELVSRARGDLGVFVDRIVVNRMPTGRTCEALGILEKIPGDLTLECLPSIPEMHSMLEHSAKRDHIAFAERERVSNLCHLPVVDQPVFPGGFGVDTGWAKHAETILNAATWPISDSTADPAEVDR
ncbi:MAG: ArsA-related P-loop ATPase [Myxococcales bacterium]